MIVECSNCHTKYNVDEKRIPPQGVKVKCHKCQSVINIRKPGDVTASPAAPAKPTIPEPVIPSIGTPGVPSDPSKPKTPGAKDVTAPPESEVPKPPEPEIPPETESAKPQVQMPEEMPHPVPPPETVKQQGTTQLAEETPSLDHLSEEDRKWHERARRLAKALASDLVLYNQDRVEEGLRDGTLAQLLGSEIKRSWEYYCQQIPKHIIESTDYFKQQLNTVLPRTQRQSIFSQYVCSIRTKAQPEANQRVNSQ
jgi:predicted Zn finger-like uncharacterized protein